MVKKALTALAFISLLASCHKNDSPVGINILPPGDIISGAYVEFSPEISYTLLRPADSVLSSRISNSNLLGSTADPVFGRTDASIYSSYEIPVGFALDLGIHPQVDSAVLSLVYNTSVPFVGDTSDVLSIDAYPLTQTLYNDSVYYSSRKLAYNNSYNVIKGGSFNFKPRLYTNVASTKDATDSLSPQLRVRLRNDFAEFLFNYNYLNNLNLFQENFKGLYITTRHSILPQPTYGSIFYVDMSASSINLYYHNDAGPQSPINITCGSNSNRYGYFEHDHMTGSSDLINQISTGYDTNYTANHNVYVQGLSGLRTVLKFPQLLHWADTNFNIAINKAELVLPPDKSNSDFYNLTLFPLPGRLYLEGDTSNTPVTLVENVYTYGGYYDLTNSQYVFEIPHSIGQIVSGKTRNVKFYLSVFNGVIFPERVVLGGGTNPNYKARLKVWYTKLTTKK